MIMLCLLQKTLKQRQVATNQLIKDENVDKIVVILASAPAHSLIFVHPFRDSLSSSCLEEQRDILVLKKRIAMKRSMQKRKPLQNR
jgi:hypothetical protein